MLPSKPADMSDYYSPRMASGVFFNQNIMGHPGMFSNGDAPFPFAPMNTPLDHHPMGLGNVDHVSMADSRLTDTHMTMAALDPRRGMENMASRMEMYSQGMENLRSPTFLPQVRTPDHQTQGRTPDHVSPTYRSSVDQNLQMELRMKHHMQSLTGSQLIPSPDHSPPLHPVHRFGKPPPPYRAPDQERLPDLVPQKGQSPTDQLPPPPQLKPKPGIGPKQEQCMSESPQRRESSEGAASRDTSPHLPRPSSDSLHGIQGHLVIPEATPSLLPSQIVSDPKLMESLEQRSKPFSWTNIDGVKLPVVLRGSTAYLSVRIVENKLLSKFPNTYPKNVRDKPPLISHYVAPREANILNMINSQYLQSEFGDAPFTVKDLVVKMDDFVEFYSTVKTTFKTMNNQSNDLSSKAVDGGWVQINNTIVPYIYREDKKYVPLSVIRYAAGLLTDVQVEGLYPKPMEADYFNKTCESVGLSFTFTSHTKLVVLESVRQHSGGLQILELPKSDPFSQAHYVTEEKEDGNATDGMKPPSEKASNNLIGNAAEHIKDASRILPTQNPAMKVNERSELGGYPADLGQHRGSRDPLGHLSDKHSAQRFMPGADYRHQQHLYRMPPYAGSHNSSFSPYHHNQMQFQSRAQMSHKFPTPRQHHPNLASHLSRPSKEHPQRHPYRHGAPNVQQAGQRPVAVNTSTPKKTAARRPYPIVKSVKLDGKSLSCILLDSSRIHYTLLEAVCRAYFPKFRLLDFIHIIEYTFRLNISHLAREDEECIIRFYGLKANALQCLKVVKVTDLEQKFTEIKDFIHKQMKAMGIEVKDESSKPVPAPNDDGVEPIVIQPLEDDDDDDDDTDIDTDTEASSDKPSPRYSIPNPSTKRADESEDLGESKRRRTPPPDFSETIVQNNVHEIMKVQESTMVLDEDDDSARSDTSEPPIICTTESQPSDDEEYQVVDTLADTEDYTIIDTMADMEEQDEICAASDTSQSADESPVVVPTVVEEKEAADGCLKDIQIDNLVSTIDSIMEDELSPTGEVDEMPDHVEDGSPDMGIQILSVSGGVSMDLATNDSIEVPVVELDTAETEKNFDGVADKNGDLSECNGSNAETPEEKADGKAKSNIEIVDSVGVNNEITNAVIEDENDDTGNGLVITSTEGIHLNTKNNDCIERIDSNSENNTELKSAKVVNSDSATNDLEKTRTVDDVSLESNNIDIANASGTAASLENTAAS